MSPQLTPVNTAEYLPRRSHGFDYSQLVEAVRGWPVDRTMKADCATAKEAVAYSSGARKALEDAIPYAAREAGNFHIRIGLAAPDGAGDDAEKTVVLIHKLPGYRSKASRGPAPEQGGETAEG